MRFNGCEGVRLDARRTFLPTIMSAIFNSTVSLCLLASVVFADKNEKSEGERQSRTREFVISCFYFLITAIAVETFGLVFAAT